MISKSLFIPVILAPIAMFSAERLLNAQQTCVQGLCGSPQSQGELLRRETVLYQVPIQPQPQAQWGPLPACPLGIGLPLQQGRYLGEFPHLNSIEPLNGGPITIISPSIGNGSHIEPPVSNRPVLRFLIRPRKPAQGRTT